METVKGIAAGTSGVVLCLVSCAFAILPIVMTVYLGIYAFNNPDSEAWLGLSKSGKEEDFALFKDEAAGKAAQATELVDVHGRFLVWFLWGFIAQLSPIAVVILTSIFTLCHPGFGSFCGGVLGCAQCCGTLAWWITGIVWRFRADGAYAAGDIIPEGTTIEDWEKKISAQDSLFQYSSGKFMFFFYVISWSLCACSCTISLIGALIGCCKAKDD